MLLEGSGYPLAVVLAVHEVGVAGTWRTGSGTKWLEYRWIRNRGEKQFVCYQRLGEKGTIKLK